MKKSALFLSVSLFVTLAWGHGKEDHSKDKCAVPECAVKDSVIKAIEAKYADSGVRSVFNQQCASCHDSSMGPWDEDGSEHMDMASFPLTGHHGEPFAKLLCQLKKTVQGKSKNKMPKKNPDYFEKNPAIKSNILNWLNSSLDTMNDPANQNCEVKPKKDDKMETHQGHSSSTH